MRKDRHAVIFMAYLSHLWPTDVRRADYDPVTGSISAFALEDLPNSPPPRALSKQLHAEGQAHLQEGRPPVNSGECGFQIGVWISLAVHKALSAHHGGQPAEENAIRVLRQVHDLHGPSRAKGGYAWHCFARVFCVYKTQGGTIMHGSASKSQQRCPVIMHQPHPCLAFHTVHPLPSCTCQVKCDFSRQPLQRFHGPYKHASSFIHWRCMVCIRHSGPHVTAISL